MNIRPLQQSQKITCSACKSGIAVRTRLVGPDGKGRFVYKCTNPKCKVSRR
jgi:hypothetical protein